MNEKYWLKLLRAWRQQGHSGFSIPYLIGSQQFLSSHHPEQTIEDLMIDVVTDNEESILLKYCYIIGDLILEIRDKSNERIPGRFPSFQQSEQSRLYASTFIDDLGNSIEEMIPILTERYQPHVDAGHYSINDGERGDYSSNERAFIRHCFSAYTS